MGEPKGKPKKIPRCPECDETANFTYYREGCETKQIEVIGEHASVVEESTDFDVDDSGFRCEECGEEFSEEQMKKILKVKTIEY